MNLHKMKRTTKSMTENRPLLITIGNIFQQCGTALYIMHTVFIYLEQITFLQI